MFYWALNTPLVSNRALNKIFRLTFPVISHIWASLSRQTLASKNICSNSLTEALRHLLKELKTLDTTGSSQFFVFITSSITLARHVPEPGKFTFPVTNLTHPRPFIINFNLFYSPPSLPLSISNYIHQNSLVIITTILIISPLLYF